MKIIRLIENDSNPLSFHDLNNVKVNVLVYMILLDAYITSYPIFSTKCLFPKSMLYPNTKTIGCMQNFYVIS